MDKNKKIFAEGIYFEKRRDNAPEYIKGRVSVKGKPFVEFMKKHINESGYVNLTLKLSTGGKYYFELDTWTNTLKKEAAKVGEETKKAVTDDVIQNPEVEVNPDDIPF